MTAQEVALQAKGAKPHVRYAYSKSGNSVGGWVEERGRFMTVASRLLNNQWVSMPYEVLVNGQPCHKPDDWIEVQ